MTSFVDADRIDLSQNTVVELGEAFDGSRRALATHNYGCERAVFGSGRMASTALARSCFRQAWSTNLFVVLEEGYATLKRGDAMPDLEARVESIRIIVEAHHGQVIDRVGDTVMFEVPADVSSSLNALWLISGLVAVPTGETKRRAPRRVTDMNGNVVAGRDKVITTFDAFTIKLGVDTRTRKR
jgi:hypothetical protein